jgi:hypothetical protein
MAPRRGRKEELPLTFKYCMIDKLVRQRQNDDVPRSPPNADYNIVGSYNLQPERRQLFAGQAPRVLSSNIPVFHPDQFLTATDVIPKYATTSSRWVEAKCNSRSLSDKGATATTSPWVKAYCTLRELSDPLNSATKSSLLLAAGVAFRSR